MPHRKQALALWVGLLLGLMAPVLARAADKVVVAVNKLSAGSPLYIAQAKGLFAQQGLEVTLLHATSAQTIGLAVVSGDAQIGMTALTAGIYTLAGRGGMKIVAGGYEEKPGFKGLAILVSRTAFERGTRRPSDLAGVKFGTTQSGSPQENEMARIARKYAFDYAGMTILPLQTLPNLVSAIKGGQVDATALPATLALQVDAGGAAKIIAWMGDEIPGQIGGVFANTGTLTQRPDVVVRFLRAYTAAIRFYDRAFQQKGPDGRSIPGDNYEEALGIVAAYLAEPPATVSAGLPYFDPHARLALGDLAEQIDIWKSLKQVDAGLAVDKVIDASFLKAAAAP